jgi:hypothetical protein
MSIHHIKLGTVEVLNDDIALVVGKEGVDIDLPAFHEMMYLLGKLFPNGVKLISDKRNAFGSSLEVMLEAPKHSLLKATAFVVYSNIGKLAAETQVSLADDVQPVKIFSGDNGVLEAQKWLEQLDV